MPVNDPSGGDIRRRGDLAEAVQLTAEMRSSRAALWRQVRRRVEEEACSPLDAAVGTLMPDDVNQFFAVVATRSDEAFLFEAELDDRATGGAPWRERASLTIWNRLTPDGERRYARWLRAAKWVLDSGLD